MPSIYENVNLLEIGVEQSKPWVALGGSFLTAPFKNFTVPTELLKHYAKNMIGATSLGQPKVLSATKLAGVAIDLNFAAIAGTTGVGIELTIITPELAVAQTAIAVTYTVIPAATVHTLSIFPESKRAVFGFLAAYANQNEIFPVLQASPRIQIADGAIADGSAVVAKVWDFADSDTVNLVKKWALQR